MPDQVPEGQGMLFEEDYLLRSLGPVVNAPDIALTELVANAWDAGASTVEIRIPDERGEEIWIADDGVGMTAAQFQERWMTLGYNRLSHQGRAAEFPPGITDRRRQAYGRNGIGRHGMFCFGPEYIVETHRDCEMSRFRISSSSKDAPYRIVYKESSPSESHGTLLKAAVTRNLPDPDKIRDILAARFLHDPSFRVLVNGQDVPLANHPGLSSRDTLEVDGVPLELFFVDSGKVARTTRQQGIAFWVGGRLVGKPSWSPGGELVIDGRTHFGKRYTFIVKTDELFDEVRPDWTGFRESERMDKIFEAVGTHVTEKLAEVSKERIDETKEAVYVEHKNTLKDLSPLGQFEVVEFVNRISAKNPSIQQDVLSVAVDAVINLEQSRCGRSLLEKLSSLSGEDIEGLDRLLGDWTVRDALTVLDEIHGRLSVVHAIGRLSGDSMVDELHVLHPLVTHARWLFGPEFDSPEYASNLSLKNAVEKVFGKSAEEGAFVNPRKRPDLLVLKDSTFSAVGIDTLPPGESLTRMTSILLIELKRGQSEIGRKELDQAYGYVEDLLGCGLIEGTPFVNAFVVGHSMSSKSMDVRKVGENPEVGRVKACTYGQLVRTADKRLLLLRERLERFEDQSGTSLLKEVLNRPVKTQMGFLSELLVAGETTPQGRPEVSRLRSALRTR